MTTMGLSGRITRLLGKTPIPNATLVADQARARGMHGQGVGQSAAAQAGMRRHMEAELDAQRANRAGTTPPGV
jgi:hypothetical protein